MKEQLQLSWGRFVFCILILIVIQILLLSATITDKDSWWSAGAMLSVFFSFSIFAGLGWARLRRANDASPIARTDIAQILQHLLGPPIPAVIWLGLTFLLPFGIFLVWVFTRAA